MALDTDTRPVRQTVRDTIADYRRWAKDRLSDHEVAEWLQHQQDTTNPHEVTPGQVGLGSMVNLPTADNADTLAGVREDTYVRSGGLFHTSTILPAQPVGVVRPPVPTSFSLVLGAGDTTVSLQAHPFTQRATGLVSAVLTSREYRLTGPGTSLTHQASDESPWVVDCSGLSDGVYIWQCRDIADGHPPSAWSYPAHVHISDGGTP